MYIWYIIFCTLSLYIPVTIGMLCPSRYSNPTDVAECGTVVCMYLEFHLLDRLLRLIGSTQTSVVISVHNGFSPCMACCHSYCKGSLVRQQMTTGSENHIITMLQILITYVMSLCTLHCNKHDIVMSFYLTYMYIVTVKPQ
jgi:hypothetical protein